MNYIKGILRIVAAVILLQTLFFKFTADPESVALFTQLDMEPNGRIGVGIIELIASILILIPSLSIYGAILIIGLMCGAIYFHITILGYNGLFAMALIALICSLAILWLQRSIIITLLHRIIKILSS